MKKGKKLLIGVGIASIFAGAIYGINRLAFFVSTKKKLMHSESQSYYSWRFGNIYFTKHGSGKPVLLIHNLDSSCSGYEWLQMREQLAKEHTVYCMDLPGYGRSDKEKMIYTNYLYVQAVNDFVKHVIKARTDIVTSGAASSIAVMACHSEQKLYGKLIFINPESLDEMIQHPGTKQKCLRCMIEMPLIGTLYYVWKHSKCQIRQRMEQIYFSNPECISSEMVDTFCEAAHLGGANAKFAYASQAGCYTRMNVVHALKKIDHSMYIIGGAEVMGMENTIEGYTYFNPAIETVLINGTKGMPHMESPEETADICRLYLND